MTTADARPWRETSDGVVLRVRLTPKGGSDTVEGQATTPEGPAIKARVRAAPEDGAANAALEAVVAAWLGVAKRTVAIVGGHKSRTKSLAITGDPRDIGLRIAQRLATVTD